MNSGAFSKPCEYAGGAHWKWENDKIVALEIETIAYALLDQKPDEYRNHRAITNRAADIEWLKQKIAWLFEKAGVLLLPLEFEESEPATDDWLEAGYEDRVSETEE
jgi:transcriptional/translational regulatory protein YebC/TACO1